ncbi:AzlC family ABC transporter permease [Desulfovibrio sp. OttesenSCG-928-A18]|nr:AzlC family ABC transporter permease [Desulfovibrio sp. OttesenSCG-928-A18]
MKDFLRGMRYALPIILGYLPVGFAFGVLAVQAGMNPLTVGLMSYFVYAGSAQLIAAQLLADGVGNSGIIVTTFIVNLRHLLMSAALTPFLRGWSKPLQSWFSFEMTDETFAANLGRFCAGGVNRGETLGLNIFAHAGWVCGGVAGALFDSAIGDVKPLGLDFALPGMFIALLLPHFHIPRRVLALCVAAALSLAFAVLGMDQWNVMLATLLAATLAAFWPMDGSAGRQEKDENAQADLRPEQEAQQRARAGRADNA